jgi:predicted transcriptional regulator
MQSGNVQEQELAGASMLEEIRRTAEHRLQEIEPLLEEAERLRDVLSVIEHPHQAPEHARKTNGANGNNGNGAASASASRARKGANKRAILELIDQHPGITPAEIAQRTGVKRTVVASTVSRLKRRGELEACADGVRLAAPDESPTT